MLSISHTPTQDVVRYCYFAPYGYERHVRLIGRAQSRPHVASLRVLGQTLDGRNVDLLEVRWHWCACVCVGGGYPRDEGATQRNAIGGEHCKQGSVGA